MKTRPAYIVIIFLLVLLAGQVIYTNVLIPYETKDKVMGTTVRVKLTTKGALFCAREAIAEIRRIEKLFSKFDETSEIGRLNRGEKIVLSPETKEVLTLADKVKDISRGAFDVTLEKGRKIDLGGVGKGYAVESARRLLRNKGIKSAIIDMHSSIAVIGNGWKVGIRGPQDKEKLLGTVILNDGDALSTSGQYEQPGHILDPRTGKPADKCLSVTLIASDAAFADALSTAVFVLGPIEGMKLAKKLGVKAIMVDKKGIIYDNFGFKLR